MAMKHLPVSDSSEYEMPQTSLYVSFKHMLQIRFASKASGMCTVPQHVP